MGHFDDNFDRLVLGNVEQRLRRSLQGLAKAGRERAPACPYCGETSRLTTGQEVYPKRSELHSKYFYVCTPCDARVGCHPGTITPLGRLADAKLRAAKSTAHHAFDALWRDGRQSRTAAYKWLAKQLGLKSEDCHIGMFDIAMCERVIALCCSDDFEVLADA